MATDDDVKLEMLQDEDEAVDDGQSGVSTNPRGEIDLTAKGRNLFFDDGGKRIDYILAWDIPEKEDEDAAKGRKAREIFEKNLRAEGLFLEADLTDEKTHFCKVHAPWEVLSRYAEILKMKMKMRQTLVAYKVQKKYSKWEERVEMNPMKAVSTTLWNSVVKVKDTIMTPFKNDKAIFPKIKKEPTLVYSRDREYLFDIPDQKEMFFNNAERSRIVDFILRRKAFGEDKAEAGSSAYTFGVKKMLSDGYYTAAYPLHEGHWKKGSANNNRKRLFDYWANWRKFFKEQPLEYIRNYYGAQIGLYYAWLGFYTQMLVVPSILGFIIFLYGIIYMVNSYPSKEICDESLNITMCPMCDFQCPYWKLSDTCKDSEYSRMFDNNGTVFFAIFMSFWGTLFLEFWKRKQSVIQHKWDLVDFVKEEEPPRPEYLARLSNYPVMKENPITGLKEPHLPFWRRRFPIFLLSYGFMLFTMGLAVGAVVGVIAYRVSTFAALQLLEKDSVPSNSTSLDTTKLITANASLITTITAACINLTVIIILNMIYSRVAVWLTDFECLRTQTEYDNSINIKLFSLQFVNYYSSILYIAFFKGRLIGRPGDYNMAFGARQEECGLGGCLIELCIQLAIIMVGKQFIQNNLLEIALPKGIKFLKRMYRKKWLKESAEEKAHMPAWEKDYQLTEFTDLYHEYLEMVLQFGFLTLFVAAFPLGPLCCMLNNIMEIRTDAMKLSTDLRRPLASRAADIGIWYQILYSISRLAIISNAFIIALTSDYIPRLVYTNYYCEDGTMKGYTQFTLSQFNTSDFGPDKRPNFGQDVDVCNYRDFREPYSSPDKYTYSQKHWHVLAARFAFVVVFENFVVVVTSLIAWLIPDVPANVKKQIRREAYVANEIVIKTELVKARGESVSENILGSFVSKLKKQNEPNGSELRHRGEEDGEKPKPETETTIEADIWLVLGGACMATNSFALVLVFGSLFVPMMKKFGEDRATTATVQSVLFGFSLCSGIVCSMLSRKFGLSRLVLPGSLAIPAGFTLSFLATRVYHLTILIGAIAGFGVSVMYVGSSIAIDRAFVGSQKSLAFNVQQLSIGMGCLVYPFFLDYLIHLYHISGTLLILGGIHLNNIVAALIFYLANKDDKLVHENDRHTSTSSSTENRTAGNMLQGKCNIWCIKLSAYFKAMLSCILTFQVGAVIIATGFSLAVLNGFLVIVLDLFASRGLTAQEGLESFTFFNVGQLLGKIIPLLLLLRKGFNPIIICVISSACGSVGQVFIGVFSSIAWMYVGSGLAGFAIGAIISGAVVALQLSARERFDEALGLTFTVIGIGAIAFGPFYGWLRDELQDYTVCITVTAVVLGLSAVLFLSTTCLGRPTTTGTEIHVMKDIGKVEAENHQGKDQGAVL